MPSHEEPWQWGLLVVTLLFFAYVEVGRFDFEKQISWVTSPATCPCACWDMIQMIADMTELGP